jgi:hypothetical protein
MPTEITVMTASEASEPANDIILPSFMASSAAMKNVLSPISLRKMRLKACRKPLWPSGPAASAS